MSEHTAPDRPPIASVPASTPPVPLALERLAAAHSTLRENLERLTVTLATVSSSKGEKPESPPDSPPGESSVACLVWDEAQRAESMSLLVADLTTRLEL